MAVIRDLACSAIRHMHPAVHLDINNAQLDALLCRLVDLGGASSTAAVDDAIRLTLAQRRHNSAIIPTITACLRCCGPLVVIESGCHPVVYDMFLQGKVGTEYQKECTSCRIVYKNSGFERSDTSRSPSKGMQVVYATAEQPTQYLMASTDTAISIPLLHLHRCLTQFSHAGAATTASIHNSMVLEQESVSKGGHQPNRA